MPSNKFLVFYKVDLVCNVVPSIGCGSRSKPILLELEKNSRIDTVKLNRKGDILVVEWNNKDITSRSVIIASVFSKYELLANELDSIACKNYVISYLNDSDNWLDAANIDQLSKEEAQSVAKQLIAVYEEETSLNPNQRTIRKNDIIAIFYDFFLNFESMQQLSDTHIYRKLVIRVIESSKGYINSNKTPKIELLLDAIDGHYESNDQIKCCN